MNKTNKILLSVVVVLLVVLIGIVVWKEVAGTPSYSAVYLRTGDLYFGKLVRFPYFGLKQPYLFQVNRENEQNPLSVQRFKNVFWGPEDFMKINRDEVVWYTKLRSDSELVKIFATNPDLIPQQGQVPSGANPAPQGGAQEPAPNPSSGQ